MAKPWKARKYVDGKPVATKMFDTKNEAINFADWQNDSTLSGQFGYSRWMVEKTFKKSKV
jgi:hypothetical protein